MMYQNSCTHTFHPLQNKNMKKCRYLIEAFLIYGLFFCFKILKPHIASHIGGWLGRNIGIRLAASRKARVNIRRALPHCTQEEEDHIITGMWDNLGRVMAEYAHLNKIGQDYTDIIQADAIKDILASKQPCIFIGAHLSNWEVNSAATLLQLDHAISLTYRAPNNPWSERLLGKARTLNGRLKAFPKSRDSARHIMQTLRDGKSLGILIDQKYNEGVEVPFFAHAAMTNPIFVQLAQKYKCPIIPVRNERLHGCHFRLTPYPPLKTHDDDGYALPVENVITQAHMLLETWITERPEQWLWLHRRWKT